MLIVVNVLAILYALHLVVRSLGQAIGRVESRLESIEKKLPEQEGQHNHQDS